MQTPYEIWDNDTFNIVYAYPTLDAALDDVREEIMQDGAGSVASWVLQFDDGVTLKNIAHGAGLIALARGEVATPAIP